MVTDLQTIICMKWGTRYGPEFVNKLFKSIQKHTKRSTELYCLTDNTQGIDKNIRCKPLPKIFDLSFIILNNLKKSSNGV